MSYRFGIRKTFSNSGLVLSSFLPFSSSLSFLIQFSLEHELPISETVALITSNSFSLVSLLCTAEGTPLELFENTVTVSDAQHMTPRTSSRSRRNDDSNLCVDNELGFARTAPLLVEMNNKEYLEQQAEETQLSQQFPKANAAQV
ncbi:hypothetical protein J1N35_005005 [Gossypium stocksii]|uniref:Uncharacterized protein n=1 Tax=Gossypium stocksii TaxID=47602 RepID=A0A9D3WF05_9ROSI|nr:hypothetical protein J1N35_005005 [Gossypium stocksii]